MSLSTLPPPLAEQATRTNGAGSNMDMKAATPPTAILEVIQKDANGVESRTTYNLGAN